MTQISILDLSLQIEQLWEEINQAIQDVLRSGHFIMGEQVQLFEEQIANYLNVKHAIAVNSGTDALVIGLRALGIGNGDEVITTPFSFFATAESISNVGAVPVFADVDLRTYNIDPASIESKITERTRAIIPVHLFGLAADMDAIQQIAERHNLKVLEDVAQAFGGQYQGQPLGTIGHMGAFSFFPTKNLGAYGDGGLIVTNDDDLAQVARMLRIHGSGKDKYHNELIGYNSRLDAIQAAILRVKLPYVDKWNAQRRHLAETYNQCLQGIPGIVVPTQLPEAIHVFHQYTVRVLNGKRDQLRQTLQQTGIGTMVYYPVPIHKLPVYADMELTLRNSEQLASEVLSLPMYPELTHEQVEVICDEIQSGITML